MIHFHIFFSTIKMGILLSFCKLFRGIPLFGLLIIPFGVWSIHLLSWQCSLYLNIIKTMSSNIVIIYMSFIIYISYFALIIKLFNHDHILQATCQQTINLIPIHHYLVHIFISSSFFYSYHIPSGNFVLSFQFHSIISISGSYCRIPNLDLVVWRCEGRPLHPVLLDHRGRGPHLIQLRIHELARFGIDRLGQVGSRDLRDRHGVGSPRQHGL